MKRLGDIQSLTLRKITEFYFKNLFEQGMMDVRYEELNVIVKSWVETPHDLMFFCGSVHAAFGVWGNR